MARQRSSTRYDHLRSKRQRSLIQLVFLLMVSIVLFLTRLAKNISVDHTDLSDIIAQRQAQRSERHTNYFQQRIEENKDQEILEEVVDIYKDFDYRQPLENHTFPLPQNFSDSVIVLCLSRRSHIDLRTVIRQTWGKNVYFVIGGTRSDEPKGLEAQLLAEQRNYQDLLNVGHPESYHSLTYKLHFSYQFVVSKLPRAEWLVKIDDDSMGRLPEIRDYLTTFNPSIPMVLGEIVVGSPVHKTGKWADLKYPKTVYPNWAKGSTGHVVSRPVAAYLADLKEVVYYQGEDTSMGIWLDESPLQVRWIHSAYFVNHGDCESPDWLILGHDLDAHRQQACWKRLAKLPEASLLYTQTYRQKQQQEGALWI